MKRIALTLALGTQVLFGQNCDPCCPPVCFERGYPDTNCCIPSAYNEPADFSPSPCAWDVWFDASFTYWMAYQEGLDLAVSYMRQNNSALNPIDVNRNSITVFQDTEWKPGFKVGFGMDLGHDHWSALAEYTWFRSKTAVSSGSPPASLPGATNIVFWLASNWDLNQFGMNVAAALASFSSAWRLHMDLLDVALTRPYYQGTHLIVSPFGGLRAAWIRQNLRINTTPSVAYATAPNNNSVAFPTAIFHNQSYSWAVGPRAGIQAKWHLGWGLRLEGDAAATIAFTQYTRVSTAADQIVDLTPAPLSASYSNYNTLRFMNDMNVGLGWGSYLNCRKYHLDLLATYDFQIFWNQNMMRALVDSTASRVRVNPGNLYLQGLTVKAQFDF